MESTREIVDGKGLLQREPLFHGAAFVFLIDCFGLAGQRDFQWVPF